MKSNLIAVMIAAALASISTVSFAGDQTSVKPQVTIAANCEIARPQSNFDLNFGDLNPSIQADAVSTGLTDVKFRCTNKSQYTVTINGGNPISNLKLTSDQTKTIPYSFNKVVDTGVGTGFLTFATRSSFKPVATISYNNFKDAKAGFYQDTVFVTVSE